MTILEKINFEEDWLSKVNLTKENIKIAFTGIRETALEQQSCTPDCKVAEAFFNESLQTNKTLTNGDVIRALFPNIAVVNVFGGDILFKVDNSHLSCSESWWNSPYQEKQDG